MILRFLMDNYRMVRLGTTRHGRKLFFQLQKERNRLEEMGIKPTTKALSEALNVPEKEVVNVSQHLSAPALSLDAPTGKAEDGRPLSEAIDGGGSTPEGEVARVELGALVKEQLTIFARTLSDDRERAIWNDRLVSDDPKSLSQLGAIFGVTKERIRQVEVRIKKRLRAQLVDNLGADLDFEFDVPEDP
jgi:RNA polymerase sigma-32 factor